MKKFDRNDEMIALAFGDLRGKAADDAELRLIADPAAARELEALRKVKATLRNMPVPEHQLSTERLSHAILSQGLEPKATDHTPWYRYAFGPIALAAAFLAFMFLSQTPFNKGEPMVAMGDQDRLLTGFGGENDPLRIDLTPEDASSGSSSPRVSSPNVAMGGPNLMPNRGYSSPIAPERFSSPESRTAPIIRNDRPIVAMKSAEPIDPNSVTSVAAAAIMSGMSDPESGVNSGLTAPDAASREVPAVILINRDRDSETGAQSAVEVARGGDLVIGG